MKYIILTNLIKGSGIGGGGVYVKNKIKFLKEKNINVHVFSSMNGNGEATIFPELKYYEDNIIYELRYPPNYFSKIQIDRIIDKILAKIDFNYGEEVIVESLHVNESLWGEIIAQRVNGKNFIYIIGEITNNNIFKNNIIEFLDFKHKRKELASITDKSLELLFNNYKIINESENYYLNAVCTNVVEDYVNPVIEDIDYGDYNIASIGRLEKTYVMNMLEEIILFANNHKNKKIKLILIGEASTKQKENEIFNMFENIENINLTITGYLFPIPKSLFPKIDVFISSAGSAYVSYWQHRPTISIDGNDNLPIGILGYTTKNTLFRSNEKSKNTLNELLELILIENYCIKNEEKMKIKSMSYNDEFEKHIKFIEDSDDKKEYYNTHYLKYNEKYISKLQNIGIRCFGINSYVKLTEIIKNKNKKLKLANYFGGSK